MTDLKTNPIYLNKSLSNLPGEIWKDVPGFEGSYQVIQSGKGQITGQTDFAPAVVCAVRKGPYLKSVRS